MLGLLRISSPFRIKLDRSTNVRFNLSYDMEIMSTQMRYHRIDLIWYVE